MNLRQLVSAVAFKEGKKVSVSVGNVREVLSILVKLEAAYLRDPLTYETVLGVLNDEAVKKLIKKSSKKKK